MVQSPDNDSLQQEYHLKLQRQLLQQDEMFPCTNGRSSEEDEDESIRSAECKQALPFDAPQPVLKGRTLSQQELLTLAAKRKADLEAEYLDELAKLQSAAALFIVPRWIRSVFVSMSIVICIALALVVASQIVSGLTMAVSLPSPFSWGLASLYGLLLLLAIALMFRCMWLFSKHRRSMLRDFGYHSDLRKRKRLQELAQRYERNAIDELCEYLKQYDIDGRRVKILRTLGMSDDELSVISSARAQLLETSSSSDSRQWLQRFQKDFQEILNVASRRIVKKTAIRVGVATAASPDGLLDRIIVLGLTIGMFKQLLEIYQMRTSAAAAMILLSTSFFHVYLAGTIQDVSEASVEDIGVTVSDLTGSVFAGCVSATVGAKTAEGLVHALLVRKLGHAAIRQISPVLRIG